MAAHGRTPIPLPIFLALAGGLAMAAVQWLVFHYAPVEREMGMSQKIFYLHLPLAWWSLFSFFVVFIASIAFLRTRKEYWEILADSAAEIGVVLTTLVLVTGSIWAKAAWWRWWIWDYRLTTSLIMWFVYTAYLLVRNLDMPRERLSALKGVLGIVAFLDVPLVFFATRLWQSHHPSGTMTASDGLEPEMRLTVTAALVAFGLFWTALLYLRCAVYRINASLRAASGATEET